MFILFILSWWLSGVISYIAAVATQDEKINLLDIIFAIFWGGALGYIVLWYYIEQCQPNFFNMIKQKITNFFTTPIWKVK